MLLLALDTSTPLTQVCLLDDGRLRSEAAVRAPTPQTADHLAVIRGALERVGVSLRDIEAFAVAIGPGSFTGLRVGLSIAKGFAMDAHPLFGVSTLHALARTLGPATEPLVPCLDAKKKEVYAAVYHHDVALVPEGAYAPQALAAEVAAKVTGESLWAGDGARVYRREFEGAGRRFAPAIFDAARAAAVADLAWEAWLEGKRPSGAHLVPNYLRSSEAERNLGSQKRVR